MSQRVPGKLKPLRSVASQAVKKASSPGRKATGGKVSTKQTFSVKSPRNKG